MLIMTMHPADFFRPANSRRLVLATLLCMGLAACSTTPPEPPVKLNVPAAFAEDQGWMQANPQDAAPRGAWWQVYNDPVLDQLEQQVAQANQSLQAALAAYDQATALTAVSRAQFYPTVGANASASRSKSGTINASGQSNSQSVPSNIYSAGLTASWVPDLWGQVRQQVATSEASAQASAATLQSTRLSLQATLAQTYLQLRVTDAQIRLAGQTVAAYQKALQLTENRYRAGVVSAADVALARTQLLGAQVTYTDLGVTRAQQQHAIAVLVGVPPSQFNLEAVEMSPAVPEIPAGVPAQLLQRRPDLAAAERKVAQANAQIGVAQTAWFPSLTLSAQTGSRVSHLADLFSAPSLFWSLGPTLAVTLFDAGARSAQVASAEAGYRQTVATYRQTVLTAFQQAEDNLAAQRILTDEAALQRQTVQAAETSLRFAKNQYKAGMVPYLNVITAQATASNAQNAELGLLGRRLTASVLLIQALGGSWGGDTAPELGSAPVRSE
ncbi:RND efflux system, outer membrane lipoprotein, NodT family [Sulfuriferula multivorans]|uniref:RND efflux system, outer membrane lipoprotein, NodT family n=2 Tax=Sulfuriferula multivorans TaxID=1559896 RepID=A0A401JAM6_9PROT|nr:RND efflux system, outer membrane lipoprotein, NodT family [Sulfuriferula multivorans]